MVGDSIWVTSTLNKKGTATNFAIHFTGKVYNSSDRRKSICKRFTESHEKSVNCENSSSTFTADINITGVYSLSDVKKSDHL